MSESSTPEERTELPTERRMSQLRRDGQIHMSHEVASVATLITGFLMLTISWQWFYGDLKFIMIHCFESISVPEPLSARAVNNGFLTLLGRLVPHMLGLTGAIAVVAILSVMLQTKWNVKAKKIDFKINFINPIQGLKRMVSVQGFVTTGKAIVKLALIVPIAYGALKGFAPEMIKLIHMSIPTILVYVGKSIHVLFWKIIYVLLALAAFDYFWGKHQWLKMNKMTKDEIKDERKSIEGDEQTKRKIIAKGLQRIIQRIRDSVPTADVVVTNPTHFAVALKYDRGSMAAPTVVAKGKGFLALRIRELAKHSGVPVLERKALARALYASTEIGSEIPRDLFRAVAEVLAYVYRLKNPQRARMQTGTEAAR